MPKFDIDRLRQNLEFGKELIAKGNRKEGTPVAFMPAGTHIVRIFADRESNFFDSVTLHRNGKNRNLCWGRGKCEICDIALNIRDRLKALGRENEYRLIPYARLQYKLYMQVVESNVSSDNWKPGETYCVITNKKVGEQLINYVYDLVKDETGLAFMTNMFDPGKKANCFEVRYEKGAQGAVNISVHPFHESPPLETGDWYIPLTDVWKVPDTEETYGAQVEAARALLDELTNPTGSTGNASEQAGTPTTVESASNPSGDYGSPDTKTNGNNTLSSDRSCSGTPDEGNGGNE